MEVHCDPYFIASDFLDVYVSSGPIVNVAPNWTLAAARIPCDPAKPAVQTLSALAQVGAGRWWQPRSSTALCSVHDDDKHQKVDVPAYLHQHH